MAPMKRLSYLIASILLPLFFLTTTCTRDRKAIPYNPDPPPYNHDRGIAFEEEFDHLVSDWEYYTTDTVCTPMVKFIALDSPVTSYKWEIGSQVYDKKEFALSFPASFLTTGAEVNIHLIIQYKNASGIDTTREFNKVLTFFDPCRVFFNGRFNGLLDNNTGGAFFINTCGHDSLYIDYGLFLSNLQTGCSRYFSQGPDSYETGYRQIAFSGAGSTICNGPRGFIHFSKDTLIMNYTSYDNGFSKAPVNHLFKGFRQ